MLSAEERQYLQWLTRDAYPGFGAIVDLGPWVGGSSAALAAGLRDRHSVATISCLDLFEWRRSYMEQHLHERLPERADFLHVFHRHTAAFSQWLSPRKSDLTKATWDGGEIEILFVDAAKTWELTNAILSVFGPWLRPGASRVVLQDFRHCHTYWLPLIWDSQPEVWREAEAVADGHTITFVPQRPICSDGQRANFADEDFSAEVAEAIFRRRIERKGETKDNRAWFQLGQIGRAHV